MMPRVRSRFLLLGRRIPFDIVLYEGDPRDFPADRDFAYTADTRPIQIVVAPKLEQQTIARIDGILMHEFGHALFTADGRPDHAEREADAMARKLFGVTIKYDPVLFVQTTGAGISPRPKHLG